MKRVLGERQKGSGIAMWENYMAKEGYGYIKPITGALRAELIISEQIPVRDHFDICRNIYLLKSVLGDLVQSERMHRQVQKVFRQIFSYGKV